MESAYMHEFLYELWRLFYEKYMCIRRITNWLFIRLLGLIDNFPYGLKKGSKTYTMVVDVAKDDPMIIHVKYWDKRKENSSEHVQIRSNVEQKSFKLVAYLAHVAQRSYKCPRN